jgi:hypothetical protein
LENFLAVNEVEPIFATKFDLVPYGMPMFAGALGRPSNERSVAKQLPKPFVAIDAGVGIGVL